ncbi:aldose 1-epimerase family protein [Nocardioides sp. Arc9.136]|uniref:aldose 1-epimerase family protein n=1 Tax=Nocardioides sp. Arc9.136 TaxID=2996826 RepID=UPI0026665157|nr:aldose 1-epimerase family protein [Nocardioides sp. Arc9.136]WKN46744.1 aldose 1-epimerase family protein [Nocardioides sp. Arc9.136]
MSRGGAEHELTHGGLVAVVTEVGGGVRLLQHDGRDLVRPYAADEVRPRFRGSVLLPWPNRVADGRYRFGGQEHQLPLTEPDRGNALHGLVCWVRFDMLDSTSDSATFGHRLVPQPGYPFELDVTVRHALAEDGLTTTVTARNAGAEDAPYGVAPHPYLVAGPGVVDDWTLQLPVTEVLEVTPDRLLPLDRSPVAGTDRDFLAARPIAGTAVDHAFTGVRPDPDGLARVRLHDGTGTGVQCVWDPTRLPWLQVHTGDLPDEPENDRRGLAVEPMTCPPDAFRSGEDLVVLRPGDEHTVSWTLGPL